ncbi:MAG: flagellar export protein FliJ [Spirochaetales bacterium]
MARRFRFRLQKILDLRAAQEKTAAQALSVVNGQVRVLELKITDLMVRRQNSFRQRDLAGNDWSALRSYDLYGQRLGLDIEKQEKLLAAKLIERDDKLALYVEARKKMKVLEKLSEKKLEEFQDEEEHREVLRLDDLNTAAFIRKMTPVEDSLG